MIKNIDEMYDNAFLIIGNGFDLAHALPTGYEDVMEMCMLVKNVEISFSEGKVAFCRVLNPEKKINSEKVKGFAELVGVELYNKFKKITNYNIWIEYFSRRKKECARDCFEEENNLVLGFDDHYLETVCLTPLRKY